MISYVGQAIQDKRFLRQRITEKERYRIRVDGGSEKALDSFITVLAPKIMALLGYRLSGSFLMKSATSTDLVWKSVAHADP